MALVLGVIASSMASGEILKVLGSISIKTGIAPTYFMASAVAINVNALVMTSSPAPIPSAIKAKCNASVPEATPMACLTPRYAAASFSKDCTLGPNIKAQFSIVSAKPRSTSSLISTY